MKITAGQIAELVDGEIDGNPELYVTSVSKIDDSKPYTLSFLANEKYESHLATTQVSVLITGKETQRPHNNICLIKVADPYAVFTTLIGKFYRPFDYEPEIHAEAVIAKDATLHPTAYIGAQVVIESGANIGENTKILGGAYIGKNVKVDKDTLVHPNVSIYHDCTIGKNCIIHSGTVIGCDGFGHAPQKDGSYKKIPQIGNVVVGNNVEIGSNCSIDRATMGSTKIGNGVKLDNLIQIAHNVEIGDHTAIAAQTGIAGSTKVGSYCLFGGQVGIVGHVSIAKGTKLGAKAGIDSSIENEDQAMTGSPAVPYKDELKNRILYKKLPEMHHRINQLEKALKELTNENN